MEAGDLRGDVARAAGGGPDFGRIRYPSRARCGGQSAALSPGESIFRFMRLVLFPVAEPARRACVPPARRRAARGG